MNTICLLACLVSLELLEEVGPGHGLVLLTLRPRAKVALDIALPILTVALLMFDLPVGYFNDGSLD